MLIELVKAIGLIIGVVVAIALVPFILVIVFSLMSGFDNRLSDEG